MSSSSGRPLDADLWRRIGVVLDRVRDAEPARASEVLAQACLAEGLRVDQVEPYLTAERDAETAPEQIDPAVVDAAMRALAGESRTPVLNGGDRLGHYEILEPLGAGGMAEVYRARDTRLGRSVAIKVLHTHLAASRDGRARFEREARVISGLNHPHICTLYDVGHHERVQPGGEGIDYLVMELVDGETLAARLDRGPLPVADVLRYASQMADALAAAHRAGITHRDLKPANVMLTSHGVKLLDFGVAALRPSQDPIAGEAAATVTTEGTIVGTLNYMAPEQLQGKQVDGRADLFALGVIVYEMLTGRKAFAADSAAGVIAAILERDPEPVSTTRSDVPRTLDLAVTRCLARAPEGRWQSAADLAAHLLSIDPVRTGQMTPVLPTQRRSRRPLLWAAGAVALSLLALAAYLNWRSPPTPRADVYRFSVSPPDGTRFERGISLSPDGRRIAFVAIDQRDKRTLWIRPLDGVVSQRVDGTDGAVYPFWSPDGREIAFFADAKLKRVDLASGRVQIVADAGLGGGGSWRSDGTILFASNSVLGPTRIQRVAASGGKAALVTTLSGQGLGVHSWPHFLPDGRHYLHLRIQQGESGVYAGRPEADEPKPILTAPVKQLLDERVEVENTRAVFADGYMFFLKGRALLAQPFDPVRLTLSGEPIRIADAVDQDAPGRSSFDVSHNGVLAYIAPPARDIVQFIWVDAVGRTTGRLGNAGPYRSFALSPDGRSVLADREEPEKAGVFARSVERFAVASGTATPVRRAGTFPTWSPDGKTFAHRGGTGRPMIRLTASDGSDPDGKSLGQAMNAYPVDWSRDGRFLIGVAIRYETTSRDLFAVELDKGHLTFPVESPFEECDPRLSPDGQWLAYAAMNESNRWEVLVRPFGKPGGVWRVSPRGGRFPRWIDNGRALLFVEPDGSLVRASLSFDSGEVRATSTARLFQHDALIYEYSVPAPLYPYDVTDGRILMRIVEQPSQPQPINVILNWQSLVRR